MGYAAALSWVLFAALLVLTAGVFRTGRLWVSYEQSDVLPAGESTVTRPRGLHRLGWYLLVALGGLVSLVPILWMVSTSLKSPADLFAMPPEPISWPLQWRNYLDAWRALPFTRFLFNTLFIVGLAVAAEVVMSAIVGYGFARFRFPGKRLAFAAMVSTMLIPGMVMMIPVFLIWRTAGLVGRFDPLVLTGLFGGTALFIFIAHQFFRTLPVELEEAARIDGAGHGRIFCQIMLPLARPVLMVIALISFQTHWNDFLGPLLYLNELDQYTLTLGLHFFQGAFMGEAPRWHWMMAMTTLMAVPTVVLFLLTQRAIFGPRRPASRPDPRNPGR